MQDPQLSILLHHVDRARCTLAGRCRCTKCMHRARSL